MLLQLILSQRTLGLSHFSSFFFTSFCSAAVFPPFHLPAHLSILLLQFICYWFLSSVFFISVIALFIRDYSEIWIIFIILLWILFQVDCLFPPFIYLVLLVFPSSFICNIFHRLFNLSNLTVLASLSFLMAVGSQFLLLLVSVLQWVRMVQELV